MRAALLSKGVRPQMVWTGSFPERNHIASDPSQTPPILKQGSRAADDSAERHFLVWQSTVAISRLHQLRITGDGEMKRS
jgi:hypothetical protein